MRLVIRIAGMTARHAVHAVRTALAGVPGIRSAEVGIGRAAIEHDGSVTAQMVAEALDVLGYEVVEARSERGLPLL